MLEPTPVVDTILIKYLKRGLCFIIFNLHQSFIINYFQPLLKLPSIIKRSKE